MAVKDDEMKGDEDDIIYKRVLEIKLKAREFSFWK